MQQQSFHPGKTNPPVEVYPLQNEMRHSGEEMTTRGLGQKTNEALQRRLFRHHPLGGPIYRVNTERCKTTQAMTVVRMNKKANGQTLLAKTGNLFHHSTLYNGGIKTIVYKKGQQSLRKSICSTSKSSYQCRFCEVLIKTLVYVRRPSGMKTAVSMQTTSVLIQSTDTQHHVVSSVGMKLEL